MLALLHHGRRETGGGREKRRRKAEARQGAALVRHQEAPPEPETARPESGGDLGPADRHEKGPAGGVRQGQNPSRGGSSGGDVPPPQSGLPGGHSPPECRPSYRPSLPPRLAALIRRATEVHQQPLKNRSEEH